MAVPLAAIGLGISVASAAKSWFNAGQQAKEQRRLTDEQVRRLQVQQAQQVGQTELAGAASGIELDSASLSRHLADMSAEFRRQADWTKRAGYAAASAGQAAGGFNFVADVGASMFQYGAANNWFKSPSLPAAAAPTYTPGQGMPPWKP